MTLKVGSKFKVKLTFGLKNDTKNLVHFYASSRKSENLCFDDWILLSMQRFRKSTGELCLMTEEWCKVWRKTDSWFQKWHEEFGEVGWNQWQVSHIDALLFLVTYKVSARKEQKNDLSWHWKRSKLTFYLKNDMGNLLNFNLSSWKFKNLHLGGLLL